jgi:hypothetical protein
MAWLRERLETPVVDMLAPQLSEACQTLAEAREVIVLLQAKWEMDR